MSLKLRHRSKRDMIEIFIQILDVLNTRNDLSSSSISNIVYHRDTTSRVRTYLLKLHSAGLITERMAQSIKNNMSHYWSITPEGRMLLRKYKTFMRLFPNKLKGSGNHYRRITVWKRR